VTGTKALTITNLQQGGDAYGLGAAVIDLSGSSGNISITYGTAYSGDTYNGYYGSTVTAGSGTLTYSGSYGKDSVTGSVGADSIVGGVGADTIDGGAGNDTIQGGMGADALTAGDGVDTYEVYFTTSTTNVKDGGTIAMIGDVVNLGSTAITVASIYTATGAYTSGQVSSVASGSAAHLFASDQYSASANVDTLSGFENITGGGGTDYLVGSSAANTIDGGAGADTIDGGSGNDSIIGGDGADSLKGGAGDDTIVGGDGADRIDGGSGLDTITITSDAAVDTIVTGSSASSADSITGFTTASDILNMSAPLTAATLTIGTQTAFNTTTKATNIAAVTTAANTDAPVYYVLNTAGAAGVMTLTEIETAITAGSAATGEMVLLLDNGTSTLVYYDLNAETDAGSGAGLILVATLVGVTGTTALATNDLISI